PADYGAAVSNVNGQNHKRYRLSSFFLFCSIRYFQLVRTALRSGVRRAMQYHLNSIKFANISQT
ncbi:MAG: hypothetical protein LUB58_02035, partial [Oscillospiraceae bacterium]|nr:hypothetical protein [Oscillospiraceae bacterium]